MRIYSSYVILIVSFLAGSVGLHAWQPSGLVFNTGSYKFSYNEEAWYWESDGWQHSVVSLQTEDWRQSAIDGWNFYIWPYFYSFGEQQWFFHATPESNASIVRLATGEWSPFGKVAESQATFFNGSFSGASSGEFILISGPDNDLYMMAHNRSTDEVFVSEGDLRSDGSFTLNLEGGGSASGTISSNNTTVSGTAVDEEGSVTFSGSSLTNSTSEDEGLYFSSDGTGDLYVVIAPGGRFYFYEDAVSYEDFGQGSYTGTNFSGTNFWDESISGSWQTAGQTLTIDVRVDGQRESRTLTRLFEF